MFLFDLMAGYSSSYVGSWGRLLPRNNLGDYSHILSAVHRLCYYGGPQEGCSWWAGPNSYGVCGWSQHPSWWSLLRGFDEPSKVFWACFGERELDWPLGLLGRTSDRWWARWVHLWKLLYLQISCPYFQWRRSFLISPGVETLLVFIWHLMWDVTFVFFFFPLVLIVLMYVYSCI